MKTIGVLGGLGPQATMDFEARVHAVSQQLIPPRMNGGYPPMIVLYYRHPPVVVGKDGRPRRPLQPDPRLFEAAERLGKLADVLVITANGPHLFEQEIAKAAGRELLSIINVTLNEIQRRALRRVGLLTLGAPTVYRVPLEARDLEYETIPDSLQHRLDAAIWSVMEGRDGPAEAEVARAAVELLRAAEVDAVILGCTEIPLLLGEDADAEDLINPAQLLAEEAVRYALA